MEDFLRDEFGSDGEAKGEEVSEMAAPVAFPPFDMKTFISFHVPDLVGEAAACILWMSEHEIRWLVSQSCCPLFFNMFQS